MVEYICELDLQGGETRLGNSGGLSSADSSLLLSSAWKYSGSGSVGMPGVLPCTLFGVSHLITDPSASDGSGPSIQAFRIAALRTLDQQDFPGDLDTSAKGFRIWNGCNPPCNFD